MTADTQALLRAGAAIDITPMAPKSIEDTGLEPGFLLKLMLKTIYVTGLETASALRERLGLSRPIVIALLQDALDEVAEDLPGLGGLVAVSDWRSGGAG